MNGKKNYRKEQVKNREERVIKLGSVRKSWKGTSLKIISDSSTCKFLLGEEGNCYDFILNRFILL